MHRYSFPHAACFVMRGYFNRILTGVVLSLLFLGSVRAQVELEMTSNQVQKLIRNGDRLADQGDFQAALEFYTQAYQGVVADVRGQAFRYEVLPNILNREQLQKEMLELFRSEYDADDLIEMDSGLKVFGFAEAKADVAQLMIDLLTEQVAGFYDPDSKRMVLIVEKNAESDVGWFGKLFGAAPSFDKDEQKSVLAHELTHALQDQLYNLNALEAGIHDDDDMMLAFSALVEGDATLLMFAEAGDEDIQSMNADALRAGFGWMSWLMPLAGGEQLRAAPPVIRDTLMFPYFSGMAFNVDVAQAEGWSSIHQAYSNPPVSTEQILHPEKYVDPKRHDIPQRVILPDLTPVLSEQWQPVGSNCLGELQIRSLLQQVLGGRQAARGWDGDRYKVFRTSDGKLAVVSVSIWDSVQDATEFADCYRKYRHPRKPNQRGSLKSESAQSIFAEDMVSLISQNGTQVWIVEGFDPSTTSRILAELNGCRFVEKKYPLPAAPFPLLAAPELDGTAPSP